MKSAASLYLGHRPNGRYNEIMTLKYAFRKDISSLFGSSAITNQYQRQEQHLQGNVKGQPVFG